MILFARYLPTGLSDDSQEHFIDSIERVRKQG